MVLLLPQIDLHLGEAGPPALNLGGGGSLIPPLITAFWLSGEAGGGMWVFLATWLRHLHGSYAAAVLFGGPVFGQRGQSYPSPDNRSLVIGGGGRR